MKNKLNWLYALLIVPVGLLMFTPSAFAQQLVKDTDYSVIEPPLKTDNPDKIEVIEFFSYACNHCNNLHPIISEWAKTLPKEVAFKRIPISGSSFYSLMAKAYYALEASGDLEKLDSDVFDAIHGGKRPAFNDPKSLAKWVSDKGGDSEKFLNMMNSFTVDSKIKSGELAFESSKATGVPAIIVDGRYRILNKSTKNLNDLMALTNKVIAMRLAEKRISN